MEYLDFSSVITTIRKYINDERTVMDTDEYSYTTMVDGRREVFLMLDEYAEEQRIQQLKQEQQRKFQQERRQNHPLKKQKDRER